MLTYMKLKTNLHFHTADDPKDPIAYSTKEGIDKAAELGFDVLALTCHTSVEWTQEYADYAQEQGVLLLSGIEANIGETPEEKRHVVVLNCDKSAEDIRTFTDLARYQKDHPDVFTIAPHPYFPGPSCLGARLKEHIGLMDAIEHSWFYSKQWDKNKKATEVATAYDLPLVATSDTHFFDFLDTDYCVVDANEKTPEALFSAIRAGAFENVTRPKRFVREMVIPFSAFLVQNRLLKQRTK